MARIEKSDAEWRAQLTEEQYRVCRQKGTEAPFCGGGWDRFEPGIYDCVCCGAPLFSSASKFDSGTGWPSFGAPIDTEAVHLQRDISHWMVRIEVQCASCDAHLGHVFPDGPAPSGQRWCINGVALRHRQR